MKYVVILASLMLAGCGYTLGEQCGPTYLFAGTGYPFGAQIGVGVPICGKKDAKE